MLSSSLSLPLCTSRTKKQLESEFLGSGSQLIQNLVAHSLFIITQFLWIRNSEVAYLGDSGSGSHKSAVKMLARTEGFTEAGGSDSRMAHSHCC